MSVHTVKHPHVEPDDSNGNFHEIIRGVFVEFLQQITHDVRFDGPGVTLRLNHCLSLTKISFKNAPDNPLTGRYYLCIQSLHEQKKNKQKINAPIAYY